jgi:hypothetical protein
VVVGVPVPTDARISRAVTIDLKRLGKVVEVDPVSQGDPLNKSINTIIAGYAKGALRRAGR